jgi:hypothetical protein
MENKFANLLLHDKFREAASIIYDESVKINGADCSDSSPYITEYRRIIEDEAQKVNKMVDRQSLLLGSGNLWEIMVDVGHSRGSFKSEIYSTCKANYPKCSDRCKIISYLDIFKNMINVEKFVANEAARKSAESTKV